MNTFIIVMYGVMNDSLFMPNFVAFYAKLNEYEKINFIFRWKFLETSGLIFSEHNEKNIYESRLLQS